MSNHRNSPNSPNRNRKTEAENKKHKKIVFGRKKVDWEPVPPNINQVEAFAKTHLLRPREKRFLSSEMPSLYYNHPFWPSPRAARIAKLLLKQHEMPDLGWIFEQAWTAAGHPVKPEGRLTHDKALKVMADYLRLSVHEFLHIKPADAILRLKLANTEEKAWRILGNTTLPVWWGGRMPCCVCDRMLPPAPAEPPEPSTVVPVRDPPSGPLPPLSPASSVAATATATATAAAAAAANAA